MDWETLGRQDLLELELSSEKDPMREGPGRLHQIVDVFASTSFGLEELGAGKTQKLTPERLDKALTKPRKHGALSLWLSRPTPELSVNINLHAPPHPRGFSVLLLASLEPEETLGSGMAAIARVLASADQPVYGMAHSRADYTLGSDPHKENPFAPLDVYEIYWLNIYGAELVEKLGRARVLSTPCYSMEELPEGGVMFLTRPGPADFASDEARQAQARALAHLRDDISYEGALERLRERSRRLTPVAADWDPDIKDLLEMIADRLGFVERPETTARFNQYRAPAVSEWRSPPLPSDVDIEPTIERYDLYAEQLAALLHAEVPSVMQAKPESLPEIDLHFWMQKFPEHFPRADIDKSLVPAIGAYLGNMLVQHLGGRWAPRRNLDESQVIIGEKAWLPFLRARHYMQSTQAILDFSLTQLYRVAARG